MYESLLQIPDRGEACTDVSLKPLAWPELVARLAARRDLRRELRVDEAGGFSGASFNPAAAAMLAVRGDGKRDVNRDVLVDGKQPWANAVAAAHTEVAGDREF